MLIIYYKQLERADYIKNLALPLGYFLIEFIRSGWVMVCSVQKNLCMNLVGLCILYIHIGPSVAQGGGGVYDWMVRMSKPDDMLSNQLFEPSYDHIRRG